jgi:hypothetical protein
MFSFSPAKRKILYAVSLKINTTIYEYLILANNSPESSALGYGLDDRDSRVRFPAEAGNISLHHRAQTGSGAHPASYPAGTREYFRGGKAAGAWS